MDKIFDFICSKRPLFSILGKTTCFKPEGKEKLSEINISGSNCERSSFLMLILGSILNNAL